MCDLSLTTPRPTELGVKHICAIIDSQLVACPGTLYVRISELKKQLDFLGRVHMIIFNSPIWAAAAVNVLDSMSV